MSNVLRYDESALIRALDELPAPLRVLFAASCAERLFPSYVTHADGGRHGDAPRLRQALDLAWSAASDPPPRSVLEEWSAAAENLVPGDQDEDWIETSALAQNAAAAVAYALTCAGTGSSQEAALAALQGYEAGDYLADRRINADPNHPAYERTLASSPEVQHELRAQQLDLADLSSAASTQAPISSVEKLLRTRSTNLE